MSRRLSQREEAGDLLALQLGRGAVTASPDTAKEEEAK